MNHELRASGRKVTCSSTYHDTHVPSNFVLEVSRIMSLYKISVHAQDGSASSVSRCDFEGRMQNMPYGWPAWPARVSFES